jgi:plastocyanin
MPRYLIILTLLVFSVVVLSACVSPPPDGTPTPSSPAGGSVTVNLTARSLAFDLQTITVTAGSRVTLHFVNADTGMQHNVAIYTTAVPPDVVFRGEVITGPSTADYTFTAPLTTGEYVFTCDVHPDRMYGKFLVTL